MGEQEGKSLEHEAWVEVKTVGGCECSGRLMADDEACR